MSGTEQFHFSSFSVETGVLYIRHRPTKQAILKLRKYFLEIINPLDFLVAGYYPLFKRNLKYLQ